MIPKAVIVFSGGLDSACAAAVLRGKYRLYGITFSYGQRASIETGAAKRMAGRIGLAEHRTVDMGFMRDLYGSSNVLTDASARMPSAFRPSIVVPARNAVFISIAAAWAYSINAGVVAYGAHTGDSNYPDCRPAFAGAIETALARAESDAVVSGRRRPISVWSPYARGMSKADLLSAGYDELGDQVFDTWSCYGDGTGAGKLQCGLCESCANRRAAFAESGITDRTRYAGGPKGAAGGPKGAAGGPKGAAGGPRTPTAGDRGGGRGRGRRGA